MTGKGRGPYNRKNRNELKWDNYLTIENNSDMYGWRGKNALEKERKLFQVYYYRNKLEKDPSLCRFELIVEHTIGGLDDSYKEVNVI